MSEQSNEEIRVKVAECLGWTKIEWYEDNQGPPILHGYPPAKLAVGPDGEWDIVKSKNTSPVPNFLFSMDAALTLCDRLEEEGYSQHQQRFPRGEWWAAFGKFGKCHHASDPSLPRAICLAFLKAKESK